VIIEPQDEVSTAA